MSAASAVGLVVGLAVGAVVGALVVAGLLARRRVALEEALGAARADSARLEGVLAREREASDDRERMWAEARTTLAGEFSRLSVEALRANNEQFLELADSRLREAQRLAEGDLDQRKLDIAHLLVPLREQLARYEAHLRTVELERQAAYTGLRQEVQQLAGSSERLQSETRNLVTALRAPATRGRWGELQLRRVVETAGMAAHCDFEEQVTVAGPAGRLRPDLVVHLPGGRQIVVDAKVPLQAFLDANDATDDAARRAHLATHARQLRAHVESLADKRYWECFEGSPTFVVAFVAGEDLLATALAQDATLLEHAASRDVLLATPTSLIALLRMASHGWQQEALADNAREVQRLGSELYRRMGSFVDHLARMGRNLTGVVESYNKAVGSLETRVLPQARRFGEMGVADGSRREIAGLEPLEVGVRPVRGAPGDPDSAPPELPTGGRPGLAAIDGVGGASGGTGDPRTGSLRSVAEA